MSQYLTVGEVALFLGKSTKWVYLKKEQLPGYFRLAGSIFFDKAVLEAELKKILKPKNRLGRENTDPHGLI